MSTSPQPPVLPDILEPGLALVLCGTAAGRMSAQKGQYYAHPQNRFWRTLHATGLTPRLLSPDEYPLLPGFGIGATDIAKHSFGMDHELPKGSLGTAALDGLRARIAAVKPKILAFTSLAGGRRFCGAKAAHGPQDAAIGATKIWILPSPSPAAQNAWNESVWHALAKDVRLHRNRGVEPS